MLWVAAALLPGVGAMSWLFGYGVLINCVAAIVSALAAEALCVKWRGANIQLTLSDGSALVTALLISIAIPPSAPLFVVVFSVACAIGLGKHAYGGLGQNVFNPAMVGYALALVSFPSAFAVWPIDGATGATALDALKHRGGMTVAEAYEGPAFGAIGGYAWEWINLAFAAGGIVLLLKRIIRWRIPVFFLATLGALSAMFYDGGSSSSVGSPFAHWTMGATMVAAFFVLTDPVSHPTSARPQILFAVIVGAITFAIRGWGNYPDGLAFAVLIGNAAAPYLQRRFG